MEPFSAEPGVRAVRRRDGALPDEGASPATGGRGSRYSRIESGGDDSEGVYERHRADDAGRIARSTECRARSRGSPALVASRAGADAGGPRGRGVARAANYLVGTPRTARGVPGRRGRIVHGR